jgi:type VI protein secretion system component Hcp
VQFADAFSSASDEPNHASFTLEACRLTAGTTLPIAGKFICPDAMYTTGNLGKSWNELDLVPHRLTTTLGGQADAKTDYKVTLAADGITNGKVGYDVLSALVLNAAKSDASCQVSNSATTTKGTNAAPFGGGTDTVIYRDATIHQSKNTVCVFDWYQRLALTSHLYPGSSLQSYMFQQAGLSGSKKTISIPVNQISPQSITKDMSASNTQDYAWNVTKSATPSAVNFADSCKAGDRVSPNVAVTVSWHRLAGSPGAITIITHVTATNPSARSIITTVADHIYTGSTQANEVTPTEAAGSPTHLTNTVTVPAFSTVPIIDFVGTVPAATATSFNDVATASYVDDVTGVPITQTIQATASAVAGVSTQIGSNATAVIVDSESVSAGFHFKVNTTTGEPGLFTAYSLGTSTLGPVVWTSGVLSGDGSVTFNKTISADGPSVVTVSDNKELTDTATLTGLGGFSTSASATVSLTSGATLTVGVDKHIPSGVTGTQTFNFDVGRSATNLGTITIPITPPATSGSSSMTVAATGNTNAFTVHEQAAANWATQPDETVNVNLPNCSGSAEFTNAFEPAHAKVKKVTVPAGAESGWGFTLNGPGTPAGGEHATTTGAGYVNFNTALQPGSYTITETAKAGFDFTSKSADCDFTVVYPADADHSFACTYTNTARGSLEVTKTVDWNGVTPNAGQIFTICITGPSYPEEPNCKTVGSSGGKLTWDDLLHGSYVVSENDPGSSWVVSGGDGATATVHSGEKTTAAGITNTRKLGSLQITKTVDWNGVTPNESQTFSICISGPSYPDVPNCKTADFDGAVLTWSNLIPGSYAITENGLSTSWIQTGDDDVTVPSNGGTASAGVTNTRKHGGLQITKTVNWNGVTPNQEQTFSICITGPSYPTVPNCKTADFDGATLTWTNLIPGSYAITEDGLSTSWIQTGDDDVTVPSNGGTGSADVTNTRKHGSLEITKTVDWNGVTPNESQTFSICITGPSFPVADCKTADFDGAKLTWTNLIPGSYAITENGLTTSWIQTGDDSATVPNDGGKGTATVTNTRKHGGLLITKTVNWNGVTPNQEQTFSICITGPSYPEEPNCKTADFDGATLTWSNLIPGSYAITEDGLSTSWIQTGDDDVTVPTDGGTGSAGVTNTRKHGSLEITKTVDWNGTTPDQAQTFEVCIQGASFPQEPDCKTTDFDGGKLTWTDLIPGSYAISEDGLTTSWIQTGDDSATVPSDGGQGTATVTNTRKLGALEVTKAVDWNGVTPVEDQHFSICIEGPSYPEADCKTFTSPDGLVHTWSNLIPGAYDITEDGLSTAWTQSGDVSATVPSDGGTASADVTNTRKLGSLKVNKTVDWNGATPDEDKTFSICITGPSYPDEPNCKSVDFDGGSLTWTNLIPGNYSAGEKNPGLTWIVTSSVTGDVTVPNDGGEAAVVPEITNTLRLGSLAVTKVVDWNSNPVVDAQTFDICITGRSYPEPTLANGGCKTVGANGGVLTWTGLIPAVYAVSELDPGVNWTKVVSADKVAVLSGAQGTATVTNTHKPVEVLGEQLARTGADSNGPLAFAGLAILVAAARRLRRRQQ